MTLFNFERARGCIINEIKTYPVEQSELVEVDVARHDAAGEINEIIVVAPEIVVNADVQDRLAVEQIRQLDERIIDEKAGVSDGRRYALWRIRKNKSCVEMKLHRNSQQTVLHIAGKEKERKREEDGDEIITNS